MVQYCLERKAVYYLFHSADDRFTGKAESMILHSVFWFVFLVQILVM